jgi:Eukaryotic aspartyl protease
VKRDAHAEVLAKHNEIIKRGEIPGSGHLLDRRQVSSGSESEGEGESDSPIFSETPTISPAVALDEDGKDICMEPNMSFWFLAYFAAIGIGSNDKSFFVVMDTGSADLWVPAANCQSQACVVHSTLGSTDSTTLQATNQPWQIQYGTGSAAGVIVADSVNVGGLTVKRMPFGAATQLSNNFAQFVRWFYVLLTYFVDTRWYSRLGFHRSQCTRRCHGYGSIGKISM